MEVWLLNLHTAQAQIRRGNSIVFSYKTWFSLDVLDQINDSVMY